jgi:hypothetical protein
VRVVALREQTAPAQRRFQREQQKMKPTKPKWKPPVPYRQSRAWLEAVEKTHRPLPTGMTMADCVRYCDVMKARATVRAMLWNRR